MIKDNIKNINIYKTISPRVGKAIEWLQTTDLENIEDGKYFIQKEEIYANVQKYITKDDAYFEAHRQYIDIQYLVYGEEKIGITSIDNCETKIEYEKEKDIEFLTTNTDFQYQYIKKDDFLIIYPHEAHKPSIKINNNTEVKKIVIKVLV